MHKEFKQAGMSPYDLDALFGLASRTVTEHGFSIVRQDWPGSMRAERGRKLHIMPATAKTLKVELFLQFVKVDTGVRFDISLNVIQPGFSAGLMNKVFNDLEDEVVAMRNVFLNLSSSNNTPLRQPSRLASFQ